MVPEARAPGSHERNKVATFKVRDPDRGVSACVYVRACVMRSTPVKKQQLKKTNKKTYLF